MDASAGFYSRYGNNGIAYLQARDGFKIAGSETTRLAPYVTARLVKDTRSDYFNNVAEFGGGLEFHPSGEFAMAMRVEYLYGLYYGIETAALPNPYDPRYHPIRFSFTFGHRFPAAG